MGFLSGVLSAGTLGLYNPKSERTSTSSSTTSIDPALAPYRDRLYKRAEEVSNTPYQAYTGERVAGFNPLQQQSFQQLGELGSQGQNLTQKGFNILGGIGSAADRISAYQNPFTSEVIDRSLSDLERQRQISGQADASKAIAARAFGGSRQAVNDAMTNEAYARQAADLASGLRYQGFNTALGAAQNDVQQQQQLAEALQGAGYGAIAGAAGAGDEQRAREQGLLDVGYQNFTEQRDYPMQQSNFLQGILSGLPYGQTQTGTQVGAPNTASNFFGNLSSLSNSFKNFKGG